MQQHKKLIALISLFFSISAYAQNGGSADSAKTKDLVFMKVDEEASFPGGNKAWAAYLSKSLNAFTPADNGSPSGKFQVIVQFIVDVDGSTSGIMAISNLGYGMEQEVIKTIKKSGAWSPAIMNGKPVKAYRRQPVVFIVEDDEYTITTKVPYTLFTNTNNVLNIEMNSKKNKDPLLTISEGSITDTGDGKFIVRVSKPGRVVIDISNKKGQRVGSASFEVKQP